MIDDWFFAVAPFSLTGLSQESQMCRTDKAVPWWSGVEARSLSYFLVASLKHLHRVFQGSTEHSFKTTGLDEAFVLWCSLCWEREESPKSLTFLCLSWTGLVRHRWTQGCHWWHLCFHDMLLSLSASSVYLHRFPLGMSHALKNDKWPQCGEWKNPALCFPRPQYGKEQSATHPTVPCSGKWLFFLKNYSVFLKKNMVTSWPYTYIA